jgi:acetyl-CoA acetyltransferase
VEDVAIIGVGLHPFGRFPGKSAFEMGAHATRAALKDAGVEWPDIQIAYGGSSEIACVDALVNLMGMTGIPFHNVANGCATAATALSMTANAIRFGQADIGIAVGMDKHPPGAFTGDPESLALPKWYGESGFYLTTLFFAMKINRYMYEFDIPERTLAQVVAKNFRNGSLNENAFRRKPLTVEQILESPVLNYPLRQFMYCAPDEGAAPTARTSSPTTRSI